MTSNRQEIFSMTEKKKLTGEISPHGNRRQEMVPDVFPSGKTGFS
jgi:hypothetical protein